MSDDRNWKLTAEENAIDSLEMAVRQLMEIDSNPWAWKWICFSLHDALYSFAVCAAARSDPSNVNRKDGKLKDFNAILAMTQDPHCMDQFTHSQALALTPEQQDAIDLLKKRLRNRLAHFKPSLWYVEVAGLPEMACHVLDVIEFLAVNSGNLMPLGGRVSQGRIKALCENGRNLARNSVVQQRADEEADEIRNLQALAPAVEVYTKGDGLPATIGEEIMNLGDDMKAAKVQLLMREPPQEPTFHELFVTVVGAVPFPQVEKIIDLIIARAPNETRPWGNLTSSITIYDLETDTPFDLPEQRDNAIAHFGKTLPHTEPSDTEQEPADKSS